DRPATCMGQIVQIVVQGIALVAEHHQPPAAGASERVQVFVTAAAKVPKVEVAFFDGLAHVAPPYRTPSHTVGSSGVVQSTRCFLNAGMLMKSPVFISTMPSSNCNRAAPFKTMTHSAWAWSYQKSAGEAWPWETIRSMRTSGARTRVST